MLAEVALLYVIYKTAIHLYFLHLFNDQGILFGQLDIVVIFCVHFLSDIFTL